MRFELAPGQGIDIGLLGVVEVGTASATGHFVRKPELGGDLGNLGELGSPLRTPPTRSGLILGGLARLVQDHPAAWSRLAPRGNFVRRTLLIFSHMPAYTPQGIRLPGDTDSPRESYTVANKSGNRTQRLPLRGTGKQRGHFANSWYRYFKG